ncbi:SGNH/GDSL hydrolase family protein [Vibrio lentus]
MPSRIAAFLMLLSTLVFQVNCYALDTKPSVNVVLTNETNMPIHLSTVNLHSDIDKHNLEPNQTISIGNILSVLLPEQCLQSKLYPNAVSVNGSKRNWNMKHSSYLDFTTNMSGMGKAITWPQFTAIGFYSCKTEPATEYQKWMSAIQDKSLTIGDNTINYKIAAYTGSGSMQGTFITDGFVIRWCSYNYNKSLNKCEDIIPKQVELLLRSKKSSNVNPTYYVTISNLPKNKTKYQEVFLFGDSLSDTHNSFSISGGDLPKGPFYNGRWADGLMWPDYISLLTGIPINNYAFGGMRISQRFDANMSSALHLNKLGFDIVLMPTGLPMSPSLLDELRTALPHLKSKLKKTDKTKKILTTFLMGGNDVMAMAGGEIPVDFTNVFDILASNIQTDFIDQLTPDEQKKLSVALFEIPDISIAPQLYNSFLDGATKISIEEFQSEITSFNINLNNLYNKLKVNYVNVDFIYIPTEKWIRDLKYNRVNYGFSDGIYNGYYDYNISSQIWGQPKTINNEPSENGSVSRSINDSSNFLGVFNLRGINETAGSAGVASITIGEEGTYVKDSLIPYRPSLINKSIIGGSVHPSTKTHFILATHFIYQVLLNSYDLEERTILSDIKKSSGFRYKTDSESIQSFNRLIDYANKTHKNPDFAGCASGEQCYFRNGNQNYVENDGFTPKVFKITNHTANPSCPKGNCSVFSAFNVEGVPRQSEELEYLRLFPIDGSELKIPLGSYKKLNVNFISPYTNFSVKTDHIQEHGECKVLSVTHGAWGTTDGRCFNHDYSFCIAGKGC